MESIIKEFGINDIWHFSDLSNLESINKNGGLLSLAELTQRGIIISKPGGNEWSHDADRRTGLDTYIHLSFLKNHPMQYIAHNDGRHPEPIWLRIDTKILLKNTTHFCCDVSNKSGVQILNSKEAKEQIDFEVLFKQTDWNDPDIYKRRQAAEKSEILVPDFIPLDMIKDYSNG
ncbi:MAG: DUF4433 domain-containing protein [Desulfobacula sp.]|nr:DUF4433 domain-containing protein [Desulfobacula sp.]